MSNKVIVIGAGAAGLMASGVAAENGNDVVLIEKNDKPGRKVMITGKGRCNVTNNCNLINDLIANVPTNGRFLYSAFSRFMPSDTIDFFEDMGVSLKVERGDRVFPESDKASDIVDALNRFSQDADAKRIKGTVSELIMSEGKVEGVILDDGKELYADKVIVATGGASYPLTGSIGDGYKLAKQAGHKVTDIKPSLVPLVCHEGFCMDLQGLSLKNVEITVTDTRAIKKFIRISARCSLHISMYRDLLFSVQALT